ncbi:hypothetical protein [Virgisporangium ochraceum]|uniref:hypothetical protein n=1 Tax=Virgisporangium ochraceum TaxID=65505 RepID=UPI00194085AB|nr:hypothetical protein [Virgisporangium ochraceum]
MITPNTVLSDARRRLDSPLRPGQRMSRAELADAVNVTLDQLYPGRRLTAHYVDFRWLGKLERGEHRWPSEERRNALRHVLGAATDAALGLYSPRRTNERIAAEGTPSPGSLDGMFGGERRGSGVDLVEFASALDQPGIGSSELTAAELACEGLDQDFARTPPDEALRMTQLLMKSVFVHLRRRQTLRHHERLVKLAARLAGLHAWACFDISDDRKAERWYETAASAAHDAKAWGLGAWLSGAQSLIEWHRRDLGRAAELIDRGIYFAGHGSDATTRAWLYALQARAFAGTGNQDGFENSYAMAERAAEHSSERDRRHGMDFAQGILDLRYYCGTSRLLLRQPDQAITELTGSRDALPESHTKARAVLTLFLADAAVESGDPSQAISLTEHALASTIHQPIVPILQQSRRIRRLVHQRDPAAGGKLDDPILAFSDALTTLASKAEP